MTFGSSEKEKHEKQMWKGPRLFRFHLFTFFPEHCQFIYDMNTSYFYAFIYEYCHLRMPAVFVHLNLYTLIALHRGKNKFPEQCRNKGTELKKEHM